MAVYKLLQTKVSCLSQYLLSRLQGHFSSLYHTFFIYRIIWVRIQEGYYLMVNLTPIRMSKYYLKHQRIFMSGIIYIQTQQRQHLGTCYKLLGVHLQLKHMLMKIMQEMCLIWVIIQVLLFTWTNTQWYVIVKEGQGGVFYF